MKRIQINKMSNAIDPEQQSTAKKASQKTDVKSLQRALEEPTNENLSPDVVADLQRIHGNQYVANLAGGGGNLTIQPKLQVTEADDAYEQEADAMADQVVARMNDDSIQREAMEEEEPLQMKRDPALQREMEEDELQMKRDPALQREMEEDELQMKRDPALQREMEEDELQMKRDPALQRKASGDTMGGMTVSSDIEDQINSSRGSGDTLPDNVRSGMESGFGADFSGVRVHTDSNADNLSRSVQAKAFTTGNDIFFQQGAYNPGDQQGQKLLAHELTHTIQQGAAPAKAEDDSNA